MSGFIKTDKYWDNKKYVVEYRRDQGFAGSPLMTYKLSKYGLIPFFIKHIETTKADTLQSCNINFRVSGIVFNRCDGVIKENMP